MDKQKIEEYKNMKWFACIIDDGFVASSNTLKELLYKFGRINAKYVDKGHYRIVEKSEHYQYEVCLFKGYELAEIHGWDIDDEENTWHLND